MTQINSIMSASHDPKSNLIVLQEKIQKLIHLHEELKKANQELLSDKVQLKKDLEQEKDKLVRLEVGYKNLKEIEKSSSQKSIGNMKRKINDIILEIDKNMSMMEDK